MREEVASFGAAMSLSDAHLACNTIDLDGELVGGTVFSFQDLGGNWCGCGDAQRSCQVLSSQLAPPEPIPQQ